MSRENINSQDHRPVARVHLRLRYWLPVFIFLGLAAVLGIGLGLDPREVPSPLIGKEVPQFDLPPVRGRSLGLSSGDLKGEVSLVNVFASWCAACREEHPLLMEFHRRGDVPIHGLNYKDRPADAATWLDKWGDPYARTGADLDGRVGIDWGVYGVPETYVIDAEGRIAYKHIGPLTDEIWRERVHPLILRLRQRSSPANGAQSR